MHMLLEREKCACEIMDELGLSQPAVSHHKK
ncbi:MAG: ArsR family transcriptional regulator [Dethiobacteria bacterium]